VFTLGERLTYSVEGQNGLTSSSDQFTANVLPEGMDCSRGPPDTPAANLFVDCTTAAQVKQWGPALPFQSDEAGSPSKLTFAQDRGKLKFRWVDHSLCEEAWAMTRAGQPFVAGNAFIKIIPISLLCFSRLRLFYYRLLGIEN
jgi:hypothetical protein